LIIKANHNDMMSESLERLEQMIDNDIHPNKTNQCKRQILQKLKANIPRTPSCLEAIWDPVAARIVDDPAEVAATVTEHWQRVFNKVDVDHELMHEWLGGYAKRVNATVADLTPSLQQVKTAILASGPSSPGPDGIPFEAYKAVVDTSALVLHRIARVMTDPSSPQLPAHFNAAILVMLPKKPTMVDPVRGDIFSPESMRPLSIVNCFNRVLANSFRLALEPFSHELISKVQRGFVRHRLITENIVDVDYESMQIRLKQKGERSSYLTSRLHFQVYHTHTCGQCLSV
jgi:hypothetical protein